MAAYIKTIKNADGDIIYPQTKTSAVYTNEGVNIEKYFKDVDTTPIENSENFITSGGVYNSLIEKVNNIVIVNEYSDTSTYALGAYCNQLGVMYKCTTAITSPEAWNAAHWTATTVAAELLAIIASLSNKVEFDNGYLNSGSIKNWAESKTIHTSTCTNDLVTDMPYAGYWGVNFYFYPAGSWRVLIVTDVQYGKQFYTIKNGANPWFEWKTIATATPPTEYDLPLTSGYTTIDGCTYFRTQDSVVTVIGNINHTGGFTKLSQIANLPIGYRPVNTKISSYGTYVDGYGGGILIYPNGGICLAQDLSVEAIYFTATFVADN